MADQHAEKARQIRAQLEALADFLTPGAVTALAEAAESDESATQAARDINRYLEQRDVKAPPAGTDISFLRTYPGAPPRLECTAGSVEVCQIGPPQYLCLASAVIKVPPVDHKTHGFEFRICLAEAEVPTYHCRCVPAEELSVSSVRVSR